jgi:hypothetical protein
MKTVRLSPVDARTWRENRHVLLDEQGAKVREVSNSEARLISELRKKALHTRKPVSAEHLGDGKDASTKITVTPTLFKRSYITKVDVGGFGVTTGREYFMSQVLAAYGECQLRRHTGQFLITVRDPNKPRPMKGGGGRAPHPETCQCKPWGAEHPGRHHMICEWNAQAPLDQRAIEEESTPVVPTSVQIGKPSILTGGKPMPVSGKPSLLSAGAGARSILATPAAPPAPEMKKVWSPADCPNDCGAWAGTARGEHHAICEHREAWGASQITGEQMFLVSLITGQASRPATVDEIKEADGEKGFVTIGDEQFAVMPASNIKKAS